ncbi:hypothetical protein BDV93DRAFT_605734 [Ceratobasidium sp. AG-I]|nr:hypothetical protein BDV93DRAFT_605734 [Ceratobasidium sp. AG-I]
MMSMSGNGEQSSLKLRRRTTPLETAHAMASAGTHSRLPSPPEDDFDVSSDETITALGETAKRGFGSANGNTRTRSAGSGVVSSNGHHSPVPSIASRLSSAAATRAPSSRHSPQSSTRTRSSLSESSSSEDDDDNDGSFMNDTAHTIANSNSWADLPLLITLVPPVFALFTGGDYLRDILLTCLLVWYLHQLIKVPWDIYLASLPPPSPSHPRSHARKLAHSELRTVRIAALILCALTPFLGATLLRLGTSLLYPGPEPALSWFSTTLFVLAAGIRPWRHLTHLLLVRTDALHLAAHRPSQLRASLLARDSSPRIEQQLERENAKVDALMAEVGQLRVDLASVISRSRAMGKVIKGLEKEVARRAGIIEGRVEVLERHGAGSDPGKGLGLVGTGIGQVGSGIGQMFKSMLWSIFPFMAEQNTQKRPARVGGKKARRLRGVVGSLPPVPETDEAGVETMVRGATLDKEGRDNPGVYSSSSSGGSFGFVSMLVNAVTWPFRFMRGVLRGLISVFTLGYN